MAMSAREARRQRNREDFQRATQQAVLSNPDHHKALSKMGITDQIGTNAGKTYREHLEDEIRRAVRVTKRIEKEIADAQDNYDTDPWSEKGVEVRRKAARGVLRGLCRALLIYENSYLLSEPLDFSKALIRLEKEFLNG